MRQNMKEACSFCDFSESPVSTAVNNSGNNFVLINVSGYTVIVTDDKHLNRLKINFCPLCGRDLRKDVLNKTK